MRERFGRIFNLHVKGKGSHGSTTSPLLRDLRSSRIREESEAPQWVGPYVFKDLLIGDCIASVKWEKEFRRQAGTEGNELKLDRMLVAVFESQVIPGTEGAEFQLVATPRRRKS